jgi:hypothetical protein
MRNRRMISSVAILALVVLSGSSMAAVTETAGNMNVPRYRFRLQLLEDQGQVLAYGGKNAGGNLLAAELYDPATGEFTLTTSMNKTDYVMANGTLMPIRYAPTLQCVMPNTDNLLFVAGFGRPEIFDPNLKTWTLLGATPDQNEPAGPRSVYPNGWGDICCVNGCAIRDGTPGNHILIFAGHETNRGLMELYTYPDHHPFQGTFNILKNASDPTGYLVDLCIDRRPGNSIQYAQLSETRILITGMIAFSRIKEVGAGLSMVLDTHDNVEFNSTLTPTGLQNTPRTNGTVTNLPDGTAMIMCGQDSNGNLLDSCEIYDPDTNTWTFTGSMVTSRSDFAHCVLANGRIAVFGGCDGVKSGKATGKVLDTIELYDPAIGEWTQAGSMVHARHLPQAVLLPDGTVLICGGKDRVADDSTTVYIDQAEVFAPPAQNDGSCCCCQL